MKFHLIDLKLNLDTEAEEKKMLREQLLQLDVSVNKFEILVHVFLTIFMIMNWTHGIYFFT